MDGYCSASYTRILDTEHRHEWKKTPVYSSLQMREQPDFKSRASHHHGSHKSGVEDGFTEFVEQEYGVSNHLANYVSNRADILFEGAA